MASDELIQTRLPAPLARWVGRRAAEDGVSVAAWLRRLVMHEANRMRTEAWSMSVEDNPAVVRNNAAPYVLERLREISATELVFGMTHGSGQRGGRPIDAEWVSDVSWYRQPATHRFLLKGSAHPWTIAWTMFDESAGRMELALRAT